MDKVEVKFGEWFERGFNLYKENFLVLILASLIALLISAATLGILAGPMIAGMLIITLKLHDKTAPKPDAGTLFKGFDYFLNSFLFVIVWGVAVLVVSFLVALVPCVGQLAALFIIYAVQTALMFGMFLIVDRGMDFWSASQLSYRVVKTNFWVFLGFSIVAGIIGSIGGIACGIGAAITAPIQACAFTVAYRDVFSDSPSEPVIDNEISESAPAGPEA
jgi:hypothetical protein